MVELRRHLRLRRVAMPLFSLCSGACQRPCGRRPACAGFRGMLFFWSLGAIIGPLLASSCSRSSNAPVLFMYTAAILGLFMAYTIRRMTARKTVPTEERSMRVSQPSAHISFFNKLAGGQTRKRALTQLGRNEARAAELLKLKIRFNNGPDHFSGADRLCPFFRNRQARYRCSIAECFSRVQPHLAAPSRSAPVLPRERAQSPIRRS